MGGMMGRNQAIGVEKGDFAKTLPNRQFTLAGYGAKGDGATDDAAAINAAGAAALAAGGGIILGEPGAVYRIGSSIRPRAGVIWDFNGASVSCGVAVYLFADTTDTTKTAIGNVTVDTTGPTNQLTLDSVTGLLVGDWIGFRLGDNASDSNEPRYALPARVLAIAGLVITLDIEIPHAIAITTATNALNKKVYKLTDPPHEVVIRNLQLLGDQVSPGVEGGISLKWASNIVLENISGNMAGSGDMGTGLIGLVQYCRQVRVVNATLNSNRNTRNQASFGRMFNLSNCSDVLVDGAAARNLKGSFIFCESYSENIVFRKPTIQLQTGLAGDVFNVVQGSDVRVENLTIGTTTGAFSVMNLGGTTAYLRFTGKFVYRGPMPATMFTNDQIGAVVDYSDGTNAAIVDFSAPSTCTARVDMANGLSIDMYFDGPSLDVIAGKSAGVSNLTTFYLGYQGNNGVNSLALLTTGVVKRVDSASMVGFGSNFGGFNRLALPSKALVACSATAPTAGSFVGVRARCGRVISSTAGVLGAGGSLPVNDAQMSSMFCGRQS